MLDVLRRRATYRSSGRRVLFGSLFTRLCLASTTRQTTVCTFYGFGLLFTTRRFAFSGLRATDMTVAATYHIAARSILAMHRAEGSDIGFAIGIAATSRCAVLP